MDRQEEIYDCLSKIYTSVNEILKEARGHQFFSVIQAVLLTTIVWRVW